MLDPVNVRRRITPAIRPTRENASRVLVERYPELKRYARKSDWERKYYGHVFTAIGCGLAAADIGIDENFERAPYD